VVRQRLGLPAHAPFVLATVGSGSDGYPVLDAAQAAVERLQAKVPDLRAILVTGPFMPADQQVMLQARATAACRVVPSADTFELMAAADAVVSMGGYNSVCEALAVARPLVIVPRATHKVEQQIRAETLAARGLARCIHPKDLTGPGLAEALEWALRCDRQEHARLVRQIIPSFDGAAKLTAYLSRWLGGD
jgi:predicted glycosyltransferase